MAHKMKGFPMMDTSSKHGTNTNYSKSGPPNLLPAAQAAQVVGAAQPAVPVTPAVPAAPVAAAPVAAAPAVAEEVAPAVPMKKNLKVGAPFRDEKDKKTTGSDQERKVEDNRDYVDSQTSVVNSSAMERLMRAKPEAGSTEMKNWQIAFDKAKKRDQGI